MNPTNLKTKFPKKELSVLLEKKFKIIFQF